MPKQRFFFWGEKNCNALDLGFFSKFQKIFVEIFLLILGPVTTTKQEIGSIGLKSKIWTSASMKCTGQNIRFFFQNWKKLG